MGNLSIRGIGSQAKHWFIQRALTLTEILSSTGNHLNPEPSRILILTAHTHHIEDYAGIARENKQAYAQKHGYGFRCITSGFVPDREPTWSKIKFIEEAFDEYEWVFWTDSDSLIMNSEIRLESFFGGSFDFHFAFTCTPREHINCGEFFVRKSIFARTFLKSAWNIEVYRDRLNFEQGAINYLVKNYRLKRVKLSPNRLFNSFALVDGDPDPYEPGDFVVHFPGVSDRPRVMAEYAARAV